jgi:PAS domain S-box-containing protein
LGSISTTYSTHALVIVGRSSASFVNGPEDLEGLTLAIPKFYTSYNYIKKNFPNLEIRGTASIEEALSLVANGEADAFIGHKLVAIYNMANEYADRLKIIGVTEFKFEHRVLIQNTDPELLSIVNKVIDNISVKKKRQIYDDWVKINIEQAVDYVLLSKIGVGILAFILLILYWNRRMGVEIKQRKKAEAEIRASEARTRTIIDNANDGIIVMGSDGIVQNFSPAAEVIFGYASAEVIGRNVKMLMPEPMRSKHDGEIKRYLTGGDARVVGITREVTGLRKNGTTFPMDLSVGEADLGDELIFSGTVRDITERKLAEQKLAETFDIISSSINYASKIQRSVLPPEESFSSDLKDHFVIWEPRDVVGGDIYWSRMWGDGILIILGDCTGHGVPGAFMTLIATGALDKALTEVPDGNVADLMQRIHQIVQITVGQHGEIGESDDGLELGICYLDSSMNALTFVGSAGDALRNRLDSAPGPPGQPFSFKTASAYS